MSTVIGAIATNYSKFECHLIIKLRNQLKTILDTCLRRYSMIKIQFSLSVAQVVSCKSAMD